MARKRAEIVDDDGNEIPPPHADHAVMAIVWLMEYGRKRGFRIGPTVQIGDTIVQVADLRQQAAMSKSQQDEAPDIEPGSDMAVLLGSGE